MHRLTARFAAALVALTLTSLGTAGCDNAETPTTPTVPTTPTTTVETFSASVNVNGAQTFNFAVAAVGTVIATYQSAAPDEAATIGMALGTWNGTACQIVLANDAATRGITVTGAVTAAGNLCVRVYDVGKLTAAQTISVTVSHP
jgi:hypothetical protein